MLAACQFDIDFNFFICFFCGSHVAKVLESSTRATLKETLRLGDGAVFSAESLKSMPRSMQMYITHTDLRHAIYIVYIYISIDTSILIYDVSNKHIYIYTYIYTCTYLCIRSLGSCVIIYVKMSKRRVNGPLMSLPKLSGQRSGRKGLQRFRKGLMHLLFRRFFFHLSLLPLVEHGNIGSITMAFPCFLGSTKTMENGAGLWKR